MYRYRKTRLSRTVCICYSVVGATTEGEWRWEGAGFEDLSGAEEIRFVDLGCILIYHGHPRETFNAEAYIYLGKIEKVFKILNINHYRVLLQHW